MKTGGTIRVEFYGVARLRAGTAGIQLDVDTDIELGELLTVLVERFPEFGSLCVERCDTDEMKLARSFTANIDGKQFVKDSRQLIRPGQAILIMSADAGG